jgi:2,4-didehydro-3-deoxy-L-rhamnonate hydrolase
MRLLTRLASDGERASVVTDAQEVIDVADMIGDGPWTLARLIDAGEPALIELGSRLATAVPSGVPRRTLGDIALLAPLRRPGKIIAAGRNYAEHAAEEGAATPADPILFTKFNTAIIGHGAEIVWRTADSHQVDWEAELAVVIGRETRDVSAAHALGDVFGYACLDDVSARDLQFGDGQWVRGKSLDTFCPFGPWIVTADEIPDPGHLGIRCIVNGEVVQDANTSAMIHGVAELVAFCSRFMTLEPGDVIATGTPGGVGVFRDPPRFLGDGDVVEVEIDRIGRLTNRCHVATA